MNNTSLYFCIGCARSGKSTFARNWQMEKSEKPRVVVTTDTIRLAMTNQRYNRHLEPVIFGYRHVMVKTLLLDKYEVLLIRSILDIDINAQPIIFETPLQVCLDRAISTDMPDLVPVIKRHHRQLQALLQQGIDNVMEEIRQDITERWKKD